MTPLARVLCVAALVLGAPHTARAGDDCGRPADLHDGWALSTPGQQGLAADRLCGIGPRLQGWARADAHAVVVARHGALAYERYFAGEDQVGGTPAGVVQFDAATRHDIASVTKSIVSLLVGIALERRRLPSLDVPVLSFFPEYRELDTPQKERITVRHLLTMSSGLAWDETRPAFSLRGNSFWRMQAAPRPDYYVLSRQMVAPPGTVFDYDSGAAGVLGVIISKVMNERLDAFAREALFAPLGITDWEWGAAGGFQASALGGLRLRPRDLAKIGQLVLQHGTWNGRQIVPAAWIEEAVVPRMTGRGLMFGGPEGISAYGYLWWLGRLSADRTRADLIAGAGNGGQRLFIVPSRQLVVVVTAGRYGSPDSGLAGVAVLNDFVLPAVTGG